MDPTISQQLYSENGALICLNTPNDGNLEFGIDTNSWRTGPLFKGIKLIPPGIHYVFYTVYDKNGGCPAPRSSFWLRLTKGQVVVVEWDTTLEMFKHLSSDQSEPYILGYHRFEFDGAMGAYPTEKISKWFDLSNFISDSLVIKLQPIGGNISSSSKALSRKEMIQLEEGMESMGIPDDLRASELQNIVQESDCYWSPIPKPIRPKNATPAELTKIYMDKTPQLLKMIEKEYQYKEMDFLGEIQFSFVCFLLGQSYTAFEQWKNLFTLVLTCEDVLQIPNMTKFFVSLMDVLKIQLEETPPDFFIDIESSENFLHFSLTNFFEIVNEPESIPLQIIEAAFSLKSFCEAKFGIPFDSHIDPNLNPTIVYGS